MLFVRSTPFGRYNEKIETRGEMESAKDRNTEKKKVRSREQKMGNKKKNWGQTMTTTRTRLNESSNLRRTNGGSEERQKKIYTNDLENVQNVSACRHRRAFVTMFSFLLCSSLVDTEKTVRQRARESERERERGKA